MFKPTGIRKLRNEFLRKFIFKKYKIKEGFHAGRGVKIWAKQKVEIGINFYMGRESFIETNVIIGDNVIWGNRVALVGRYDHNYQEIGLPTRCSMAIRDLDYNWKGLDSFTIIEDDVWVGYGTTILSGVKICEGSIIGAGSLVTKDVEPYCIYAGNPAKKVRNRFNTIEELHQHLDLVKSKYKNILIT